MGFYNLVGTLTSSEALLRLLLPEPKLNQDKYTQCEWCANECPVNNVTMHSYPAIGNKCIRCYRCVTGCPEKASDTNWRLGNLVVWLLYNESFMHLFGEYKQQS